MRRLLFWIACSASLAVGAPRIDRLVVHESAPLLYTPLLQHALVGQNLDSTAIQAALVLATSQLNRDGFLLASVEIRNLSASSDSTVVLHLHANKGNRFVWGNLVDQGTSRLRPYVLQRLANWRTGTPANPQDLERLPQRFAQEGFVEVVTPFRPVQVPRTGQVHAVGTLRDLPASWFDLAGGWSSQEDLYGILDTRLANLLGTARTFELGYARDAQRQSLRTAWKEPWLGAWPVSLRMEAEYIEDSLARKLQLAGDLGWSPTDFGWQILAGFAWTQRLERALDTTLPPRQEQEWSTRWGVTYTQGDPEFGWPRERLSSQLHVQIGQVSQTQRILTEFAVDRYQPINTVAHVRTAVHGRALWPLDSSVLLAELTPPGGANGWRGWREGTPRSPHWVWATFEVGLGTGKPAGVVAYLEPGWWWSRDAQRQWNAQWSSTAGVGLVLLPQNWDIVLGLAGNERTQNWEDLLLHVRAVNHF